MAPYSPHIAYYDNTHNDVRHAYWTGSAWNIEVVDTPGLDTGRGIGIAIDPNPPYTSHIAYTAGKDLRHAYWDGSEWVTSTIEYGGSEWYETITSPAISVDSAGTPHILYHGGIFHGYLKYASWTGSIWDIENVDHVGNSYTPTSLALDSSDNPHILYVTPWDDEVTYGYRTGGSWTMEVIETHYADYVSLALDSDDQPHVSYYRGTPEEDLIYGHRDNDTWSLEVVDNLGGTNASLVLDGSDYPRIAYSEGTDLKFAWQTKTSTIPATGSTFSAYGTAHFDFPAGVFTDTVVMTYTVAQPFSINSHVGVFFDVDATYVANGQSAQPIPGQTYTIVVHYDEATVPYGINEEELALYYWNGTDWVMEPTSTVDTVNNTLTATPNHFSVWAGLFEAYEVFLPMVIRQ